jgi:hypothetical protein
VEEVLDAFDFGAPVVGAIHYPEQNLDRCRTQFKPVRDMEEQFEEMKAVIRKYAVN